MKPTCTLFFLIYCFTVSQAQTTSLGMQVKPRMEYRDWYLTLPPSGAEAGFHTNDRIRLQFAYTSPKVEVVVQPQYVYVWGQNTFNAASEANFSMYQGYAQMNFIGKAIDSTHRLDKFGLRLGRQELNYDGGRFLSNLDWAPQGIRHDAALFILEDNGWTLHAGAGFNQEAPRVFGTTFNGNLYKSFQMVWLHKQHQKFSGSILMFKDDFQRFQIDTTGNSIADGVNSRITAGTMLEFKLTDNLSIGGEFYMQRGKDNGGNTLETSLVNLHVTGVLANGKVNITPGFDIASGSDGLNLEDTVNRFFNPTYGINHKFYGFMDYFYVASPFGNAGLQDFYVRSTFKLNSKWNTWLHLHYFASANNINSAENPGTAADPYLGTEIDWIVNHQFADNVQIQFGACYMAASSTMQQIKNVGPNGGNSGVFTYLQFMFTPKFF